MTEKWHHAREVDYDGMEQAANIFLSFECFCLLGNTWQATCHAGSIFFNASTLLDNKKDRSTMT
jgi:hypothetical protein